MRHPSEPVDPNRTLGVGLPSLLVALAAAWGGCSLHFRMWTDYRQEVLSKSTVKETLPERRYAYRLVFDNGHYDLVFEQKTLCRTVTLEKVQETMVVKVRAPLAPYYMAVGAVIAACSIPFYYMAAVASGDRKRNNALVGSFAFLLPGSALVGFGVYQYLKQGDSKRQLGTTVRRKPGPPTICGKGPASGRLVKLGTQTGIVVLGRTDPSGRIRIPHRTIWPLIRREGGKIVKVYLEVYLDGEHLGDMNVPWPIDRLKRLD